MIYTLLGSWLGQKQCVREQIDFYSEVRTCSWMFSEFLLAGSETGVKLESVGAVKSGTVRETHTGTHSGSRCELRTLRGLALYDLA